MGGLAVVTGATGYLGGHLCTELRRSGYQVRALVHSDHSDHGRNGDHSGPGGRAGRSGHAGDAGHREEALRQLDIETLRGDIRDPSTARRLLDGLDPAATTVFHLAAVVSIRTRVTRELSEVNVGGTRNVVAAAREASVSRLVHVSSVHAQPDLPPGQVHKEVTSFDPTLVHGGYAKTKAEATQIVLGAAADLDVVVVQPSGLVGPGDRSHGPVTTMVLDLAAGRLPLTIDGGYDFADVRDVAAATAAAATLGRRGECYLLTGRYVGIPEALQAIGSAVGVRPPRLVLPYAVARAVAPGLEWLALAAGRDPVITPYSLRTLRTRAQFSHAKASRELGYDPRDPVDGLRDCVDWLREIGELTQR